MITESLSASNAWAPPFDLTSKELSDVIAVTGEAVPLKETPYIPGGSKIPNLYKREFKLTDMRLLRGESRDIKKENFLIFAGYTTADTNQRSGEQRCCLLDLEGQDFFDSLLPAGKKRVLLLIGGPAIIPGQGFGGRSAVIEKGTLEGQPVRAFLLNGLDADLDKALPRLLGWQKKITTETVREALTAPHPLAAIDALRIVIKEGMTDHILTLADSLLFPTQLSGVRTTTVALVAKAVSQLPAGSKETDTLLEVILKGWEEERTYQIESAYLRALQSISGLIYDSGKKEDVINLAEDYSLQEIMTLSEQLAKDLNQEK